MDNPGLSSVENTTKSSTSAQGLGSKKLFILIPVILVLVLLAGIFVVSRTQTDNRVQGLVNESSEAVIRGDYKKARQGLVAAYKIDKSDPDVQARLISTYALEGNQKGTELIALELVTPYINEALKTSGNNAQVLVSVGYAYEAAGDYDKAAKYYDRAVKLDPNSADAWFHRGHNLQFLGKYEEARDNYDRAYKLDPKNPSVLIMRGNSLFSDDKKEDAFQSFKAASERTDINATLRAEALTGAALVRGEQDNYRYIKEALELAKKAIDLDPNFSPGLATYGYYTFITTGDSGKSYDYVKRAIEANPKISKNYLLLGIIYRTISDYDNSIAMIRQAIEIINYDNTILSNESKELARADYTYELARTYSIGGVQYDTLPLIKSAIALSPVIKGRVSSDYRNGTFSDLASNPEFLSIIQQ